MKTEFVYITCINAGDTVLIDGIMKTVCKCDIKVGFMGRTLFGDSHRLGLDKIEKVTFKKFYKGIQI
jgi:hypothetical protein